MSRRGIEFLDRWISANVHAMPMSDQPVEIERLAALCILEAGQEGIVETELVEDLESGLLFELKRQVEERATTEVFGEPKEGEV